MKMVQGPADVIVGCRSTRIYCRPGCPAGKRMKVENKVRFASREEAVRQGFRACKVCKPDGEAQSTEVLYVAHYDGPLGRYILVSSERGIVYLAPEDQNKSAQAWWRRGNVTLREDVDRHREAMAKLDRYFSGQLQQFNLPLDLRGTPFQRKVWQALQQIPYGETRSYGEIARAVGLPKGSRAVGLANGANPVSIIVPCHRVIGSSGALTGYGGGLQRKQALLALESRAAEQT